MPKSIKIGRCFVAFISVFLCVEPSSASTEPATLPFITISYTSNPPAIDGKLDDDCWKNAAEIFPFVSQDGKTLPSQQTKVWTMYDSNNIYIGFESLDMHLNPVLNQLHAVKMLRTKRDSNVWEDDSVEVFISPNGDGLPYYHFVFNPLGTVYDAYCPTSQDKRKDWNGKDHVRTSMGAKYWVAEIALPLSDFTKDISVAGTEWRINFNRSKQALKEVSSWSPTLVGFHNPDRFGRLFFGENVPIVSPKTFPLRFEEGENHLDFEIKSLKDENIEIETVVKYVGADKVVEKSRFEIKGGTKNLLRKTYIIYTSTPEREKSEEIVLSYKVSNPSINKVYYLSSQFIHKREIKNAFTTRLMTCTFGAYFNQFKELYLVQKGVQYILVIIQSNLRDRIDDCRFVLEIPAFISLVNPISTEKKAPQPIAMNLEEVERDGIIYRRYVLTFPNEQIYSNGNIPVGQVHNTILLEAGEAANSPDKMFAYFYTEADLDGSIIKENENKIPLYILPPLNRKTPKKIIIQNSSSPITGLISGLSPEERNKIYETWHLAGFNVKQLDEFGGDVFSEDDLILFRRLGMEPIQGLPTNTKSTQWHKAHFPDAIKFLNEHPEYRAQNAEGKYSDEIICISHLLDGKGNYRLMLTNWLGQVARKFSLILWDFEISPAGPASTCFCSECIKSFRKYSGIEKELSPDKILSKHKKEWIDFQCWRNAEFTGVLQQIIKNVNSAANLVAYSGYQSNKTREAYGVNWNYISKYIDAAACGYGRPVPEIKSTLLALKDKPLIAGELIWTFRDVSYPMDNVKINLFRRISDSGGGISTYHDFSVDGRFYRAINDISSLTANYEDFFTDFMRRDELIIVKGLSGEYVSVLTNKRGEMLIFLFNEFLREKECYLTNPVRNSSMIALDYFSGKILPDTDRIKISILPKDVKVIFAGYER